MSIHDSDPTRTAAINLSTLAFLALFIYLAILTWRRLGAPYGLYCLTGLAIPLSVPSSKWPLWSIPRFGLALFPLFITLATIGRRPRLNTTILATSTLLLGAAISQWATWQWVA